MYCNSIFADRTGMPVSKFIAAAAACGILLCFAAETCKSYCNGCMTVAFGNISLAFWTDVVCQVMDFQLWHYWEVLVASFVVERGTGNCFVQAL